MRSFPLRFKTRQQAEALQRYMEVFVLPEKPENVAESLIKDLMTRIHQKVRRKVETYSGKGWNVALTPEEAKAYHLYWQNRAQLPGYVYEQNIIQGHVMEIDKVYG